MARITVEDCIDKFPSRFELVLVASNRARKLHSGEESKLEKNNDKNTVIALREISEETISIENLKNSLIEEYQTVSISDDIEEGSLENLNNDEEFIETDSNQNTEPELNENNTEPELNENIESEIKSVSFDENEQNNVITEDEDHENELDQKNLDSNNSSENSE